MNASDELFEIQFKADRRDIFRNASGQEVERDDYVIVEAEKGEDIGFVHQKGCLVRMKAEKMGLEKQGLKRILRPATDQDVDKIDAKGKKESEAFDICKKKIGEHSLPMKLVDVEIQFDHSKITFYFTADQRVDFRELVRELASIYRTRIELRQIGVRDEARRTGGYGVCGRKQCCTTFIKEFEQIATQMAKEQQLSLNPAKISGNCGRLLCCLRYELDFYQEMAGKCPHAGTRVKTEKGEATVIQSNIFTGTSLVKFDSGDEERFPCSACAAIAAPAAKTPPGEAAEKQG